MKRMKHMKSLHYSTSWTDRSYHMFYEFFPVKITDNKFSSQHDSKWRIYELDFVRRMLENMRRR